MDPAMAAQMFESLCGKSIGGWVIERYLGAGKSAVVMAGSCNGQIGAVKVFDPEIVNRFGREKQLRRIERECSLRDHTNANLVRILGGGSCDQTNHLYLVMETIDAPNLNDVINLVPREKIPNIISQIASAAEYLESLGFAHRDIKPENIAIAKDFEKATLLDLGVLRPIGDGTLTEQDGKVFLGTLMYSSPEYLMREEMDTKEGWRAVTFYQIGAVLHDLIMRRKIFKEFEAPYAALVHAVCERIPYIASEDVGSDLVVLAQNCLLKDPTKRLRMVTWESFRHLSIRDKEDIGSARERVLARVMQNQGTNGKTVKYELPSMSDRELKKRITEKIRNVVRDSLSVDGASPPRKITPGSDGSVSVAFAQSTSHGLPHVLKVEFYTQVVDAATITIELSVRAALLGDKNSSCDTIAPTKIFGGQLESTKVKDVVDRFLWGSIEAAQKHGDSPLSDGKPLELPVIVTPEEA